MRTTKLLLAIASLGLSLSSFAQVKIGDNPTTINPGSVLELESTNKGLLLPRLALTNTTTWLPLLGTPAAGMHVYNTNAGITSTNSAYPVLAAKTGEYYYDGTGWRAIATVGSVFTSVTGNLQTFTAYATAEKLLYQTEVTDPSNIWNPATSIFTVPVDGVYLFTTYTRVSGNPIYIRGRISFLTAIKIIGGASTTIVTGIAESNDWGFSTGAKAMRLTAGQQVQMETLVQGDATLYQRTMDVKSLDITKISD